MAGRLRVVRQRIRSVKATSKITRAMELIAASRIVKAQQRVAASTPYANELTRVVSALATFSHLDHPLATEVEHPRRAAVLVCCSDRGLAGAYSSSVLRETERLLSRLRDAGIEAQLHVVGRKGISYFRFRGRELADEWTGFTDAPLLRRRPHGRGRRRGRVRGRRAGRRGRRDPRRLHPLPQPGQSSRSR